MTARTQVRSRSIALFAALAAAVASVTVLMAAPASAAPTVSVSSSLGNARVSLDGPTTVSVSGRGFQSVQGGFGGIYVMFGWVDDPSGGGWRPSNGGVTGVNYLYVPDSESRDNAGYQRFVTFPGSSTAETANGGELAANGTWSFDMVVPGPVFDAQDRSGNVQQVDCRQVTCGLITIGAHGVVNPNNESFTPLTFVSSSGGSGSTDSGGQSSGGGTASGGESATDDAADDGDLVVAASGPATLAVEQTTIIAGRVLGFTGRGFAPGEQVMASIGAGIAGAGPLLAGQFGEIAGAITLPADIRAGSHILRLEGAGSGEVAEVTVSVMADPSTLGTEEPVESAAWSWAFMALVVAATVLAVLIISSLITALVRRRRARSEASSVDQPPLHDDADPDSWQAAPDGVDGTAVLPVTPDAPSEDGSTHGASSPQRTSVMNGDGVGMPRHARSRSVGTP